MATNLLIRLIERHYDDQDPRKALVLSLHGDTGTGKNFVSEIIIRNIYKLGRESKFVHFFIPTQHFPHKDKVETYKVVLVYHATVYGCNSS
jgi:torsin-1